MAATRKRRASTRRPAGGKKGPAPRKAAAKTKATTRAKARSGAEVRGAKVPARTAAGKVTARKAPARRPPAKAPARRPRPSRPAGPAPGLAALAERDDRETGDEVLEVFRHYDRDASGSIDAAELAALLEALGAPPSEEELAVALDVVDRNRSGKISWSEFSAWWKGQ